LVVTLGTIETIGTVAFYVIEKESIVPIVSNVPIVFIKIFYLCTS